METKHTPGPWRVGRAGSVVSDAPVPEMGGSDAIEFYGSHLIAESITPANAALIAAAPDLLVCAQDFHEVLRELDQFCECGEADCRTTRVRAAIAKATGAA